MFDVERVLERGALAGAGAVPGADDQDLTLPGLQPGNGGVQLAGRLHRMVGGADRDGVAAVRAEPLGGLELQLGAGRVDEEVVVDSLLLALGTGLGGDDVDAADRIFLGAVRVDRHRSGLHEFDLLLGVDGCQREDHLLFGHLADAHPDVGRDPGPV